jgi:putative membrane protein
MRASFTLSLPLTLTLVACGASQEADTTTPPPAEEPAAAPTAAATEPAPAPTPEASPPATDTAQAAPAAPQLNDNQIAAFLAAANQGEIQSSELARKNTRNAEVKKLAAEMIKDHKAADKQASALFVKAGIQPEKSADEVKTLESKAQTAIEELKARKGAEFDKAYVDAQVTMHQDVIDAIDQRLLPACQNAELKGFITEIRPKLQAHLDHAKALQTKLGGQTK